MAAQSQLLAPVTPRGCEAQQEYSAQPPAIPVRRRFSLPSRSSRSAQVSVEFRVLLVGERGVGKTALLQRHLTGEFSQEYAPTQNPEESAVRLQTNCGNITFRILETAVEKLDEDFFAPGTPGEQFGIPHGALAMYDTTRHETYAGAQRRRGQLERLIGPLPLALVGGKADATQHQATCDTSRTLLFGRGAAPRFETSARSFRGFERPFLWLARRLVNQPGLQLIGDFAEAPRSRPVVPALRALHFAELAEAAGVETPRSPEPTPRVGRVCGTASLPPMLPRSHGAKTPPDHSSRGTTHSTNSPPWHTAINCQDMTFEESDSGCDGCDSDYGISERQICCLNSRRATTKKAAWSPTSCASANPASPRECDAEGGLSIRQLHELTMRLDACVGGTGRS